MQGNIFAINIFLRKSLIVPKYIRFYCNNLLKMDLNNERVLEKLFLKQKLAYFPLKLCQQNCENIGDLA